MSSSRLGDARAEALNALAADDWVWFLRQAQAAAREQRPADEPLEQALMLPISRLAGGEVRADVCRRLVSDTTLWQHVTRVIAQGSPPPGVRDAISAGDDVSVEPDAANSTQPQLARLRARVRELTHVRDELQRQLTGAQARAASFEASLSDVHEQLRACEEQHQSLASQLAAADHARTELQARLERRHSRDVDALRAQLRALRRELAEQQAARNEPHPEPSPAPPERHENHPFVVRPGRPTRLPDGVAPGTREEADLLLTRGRRVLVDGYNCTLQHRGHDSLADQRAWLGDLAAALAQRRALDIVLVFDGTDDASGSPVARKRRGLAVRFTQPPITADDEIVLDVGATDEPVVVVTDDRELADRVRAIDGDVLATAPFVWLAR